MARPRRRKLRAGDQVRYTVPTPEIAAYLEKWGPGGTSHAITTGLMLLIRGNLDVTMLAAPRSGVALGVSAPSVQADAQSVLEPPLQAPPPRAAVAEPTSKVAVPVRKPQPVSTGDTVDNQDLALAAFDP